jgi:hypothetical protein
MFVHVILVHMVEMAVVKIIQMAVMANRGVPAFRAMLMSVVGMVFLGACGHCRCSLPALGCSEAPSFRSTRVSAEAGDAIGAHKVD